MFWQYQPDLPGTAAGSLLAAEAGAVVTTLSGQPWRPDSPDVLVAAPGLHAAALATLANTAVTWREGRVVRAEPGVPDCP